MIIIEAIHDHAAFEGKAGSSRDDGNSTSSASWQGAVLTAGRLRKGFRFCF